VVESRLKFAKPYTQAGPGEFISLVKNAKAVCTDSFHGTALSIIYKKQFYTLKRHQKDCEKWANFLRIDNILNKIHIDGRLVKCVKDINNTIDINYDNIDDYLKIEIERSKSFLKNSLH